MIAVPDLLLWVPHPFPSFGKGWDLTSLTLRPIALKGPGASAPRPYSPDLSSRAEPPLRRRSRGTCISTRDDRSIRINSLAHDTHKSLNGSDLHDRHPLHNAFTIQLECVTVKVLDEEARRRGAGNRPIREHWQSGASTPHPGT